MKTLSEILPSLRTSGTKPGYQWDIFKNIVVKFVLKLLKKTFAETCSESFDLSDLFRGEWFENG